MQIVAGYELILVYILLQRKGDLESKLEMEETKGKRRVKESKKELMRDYECTEERGGCDP